ncbi:MAG TPA: hypothetical protein VHF22_09600, partial [Planctomycetota bacterium]|nr:hypothetical protein [Planctomycetota bacterium]
MDGSVHRGREADLGFAERRAGLVERDPAGRVALTGRAQARGEDRKIWAGHELRLTRLTRSTQHKRRYRTQMLPRPAAAGL